nr:hypothetical protein [Neorhizobium tomejilense]
MANLPCVGCWWIEGGRCFQDKLADVQGLENAPRNGLIGSGVNGLEITDGLITACMDRGVHQRTSAVYGRLAAHLKSVGIDVERMGPQSV